MRIFLSVNHLIFNVVTENIYEKTVVDHNVVNKVLKIIFLRLKFDEYAHKNS